LNRLLFVSDDQHVSRSRRSSSSNHPCKQIIVKRKYIAQITSSRRGSVAVFRLRVRLPMRYLFCPNSTTLHNVCYRNPGRNTRIYVIRPCWSCEHKTVRRRLGAANVFHDVNRTYPLHTTRVRSSRDINAVHVVRCPKNIK